ncbi:hypothetical protein [Neobacillus ginsengisoli]|uniref:IDEAL domain-containing protein n=1 Tax=Neobacillus ginsengisoli TaxID=904295 RepID=A0ABT9Y0C0_9BACI|nr:hypothetical protein [Neobacillus ginsengisoli]MDQ0201191.1 hypothetical protein [Neobacillus ginsengisoli]
MSFYDKMFSTLGYKTLQIIFNVDEPSLTEEEKRLLVQLIILMEKDTELKAKVNEVISSNLDNVAKLDMFYKLEKNKE